MTSTLVKVFSVLIAVPVAAVIFLAMFSFAAELVTMDSDMAVLLGFTLYAVLVAAIGTALVGVVLKVYEFTQGKESQTNELR